MNDADHRLVAIAAEQRQVFTRPQAREAGLAQNTITRRLADQRFVRVGACTLTFSGVNLDWRGRLAGDQRPSAEVEQTGLEAAALHGLDGYAEGPLVYLVDRRRRNARTLGDVLTSSSIAPHDRVLVDGLDVTSPTRTIVTLIGRVDRRRLGNAFDSACRMRLTTPAVIDRRLDELGRRGRAGIVDYDAMRQIGEVQSWLEREFLRTIAGSGLPRPALQRTYRRDGVHIARVDFDFAPLPIVVEVGGRRGYLSLGERQRQERRRNELQLLGTTIYFFTTEDVRDDKRYVVETITRALRAA